MGFKKAFKFGPPKDLPEEKISEAMSSLGMPTANSYTATGQYSKYASARREQEEAERQYQEAAEEEFKRKKSIFSRKKNSSGRLPPPPQAQQQPKFDGFYQKAQRANQKYQQEYDKVLHKPQPQSSPYGAQPMQSDPQLYGHQQYGQPQNQGYAQPQNHSQPQIYNPPPPRQPQQQQQAYNSNPYAALNNNNNGTIPLGGPPPIQHQSHANNLRNGGTAGSTLSGNVGSMPRQQKPAQRQPQAKQPAAEATNQKNNNNPYGQARYNASQTSVASSFQVPKPFTAPPEKQAYGYDDEYASDKDNDYGSETTVKPPLNPYAALSRTDTNSTASSGRNQLFTGLPPDELDRSRTRDELVGGGELQQAYMPPESETSTLMGGDANSAAVAQEEEQQQQQHESVQQENEEDQPGWTQQGESFANRDFTWHGNDAALEEEQVEEEQDQEQDSEEEEIESIKQRIRFEKQGTIQSSRNALMYASQAEQSGRSTLGMLGDQSERLTNTEQNLNLAQAQNKVADEKAKELKSLNRSMFAVRVSNPFNSKRRNEEREAKIKSEYEFQRRQRDRTRQFQFESSHRVMDGIVGGGAGDIHSDRYNEVKKQYGNTSNQRERARYQFEADEEDDVMEDEIDRNINELGQASSRLRNLALATSEEVTTQNDRLDRIGDQADVLDVGVHLNTTRLARIH